MHFEPLWEGNAVNTGVPCLKVPMHRKLGYDLDRSPYTCLTESALVTMLHQWGIDAWSLQQAVAALRKGEVAVVSVVLSEAQLQTYFPPQRPACLGRNKEGASGEVAPSLVPALGRDVLRTRAKASV